MKDVLTDLNAEGEVLPLSPPREDWFGHKGMVQAAEYIRKKLQEEDIIACARAKVGILCANESLVIKIADNSEIVFVLLHHLHNR